MDASNYVLSNRDNHLGTYLSEFKTLGSWWDAIGTEELQEAVPVCYCGVFSGSVSNINRRSPAVWNNIEASLSRGGGIQESQYAERSWALLMSKPLEGYQIDALLEKADGVHVDNTSHSHGVLLRRPKLFLHIGTEGTSSTEVLTESLVDKIELLELDGYKVAVHGKYEGEFGCTMCKFS